MNQQNVFNYVMNTPHNTNPTILRQMLKDVSNTGGNVNLTIEGETLVIAENSAAIIKDETLIL